ncbi:MAG TPA: hypothetical protein VG796_02045 [Verrucomicrobiales bacterium]|nr:hypothetical protein [Verrucomicrobiales bacterium]
MKRILLPVAALLMFSHVVSLAESGNSAAPRLFTPDGKVAREDFFPIAVWLQSPRNAERYKAAGINLYVGLWKGPTTEQLAALEKAGMAVICDQNETSLKNLNNPLIAAWMHGDEPDNAQSLPSKKGYGPPILPEKIIAQFNSQRVADRSRPVLLNLGQGVAWDNYIGRGVRRNHPEDYAEYVKGSNIVSFDIYPANHDAKEIAGRLEYVPRGVERLIKWAGPDRTVWNCIECTGIDNPKGKPTPAQVRSEVWMSLIKGSRGLIYFVHQFKPGFSEAALLDDKEMLEAVTALNAQIKELAPVLNSPTIPGKVASAESIATMVKRHRGHTWLFAANLSDKPVATTFTLEGDGQVEVIGESRKAVRQKGAFTEEFAGYAVHLYRMENP